MHNPNYPFTSQKKVALFGAISALIGMLGIVGWIPGLRFLGRIRPDYIPMAPSTSISFLLLGSILAIYSRRKWQKWEQVLSFILIVLISIFGLLEVVEVFTGLSLNFEDVLFPAAGTLEGIPVARMSPSTGGAFFIAGLSTLFYFFQALNNKRSKWRGDLAGSLGSFVLLIGATYILSYIYGTPFLYGEGVIPMAVTTAAAFFAVGIGLAASSGELYFPGKWFLSSTRRAQLIRIFLPLTISIILLEAFLLRLASFYGINDALILSITLIIFTVITGVIIIQASRYIGNAIDSAEAARKRSEEKIQKLNEELEERVKERTSELEAFAYSVSHDLRAPLRAINAFSAIVQNEYSDKLDEQGIEYLDKVRAASLRMDRLINDLLTLSHLGRQKLNPEDIDLGIIAKRVFSDLVSDEPDREINFRVSDYPSVLADEHLMELLLTNLLSNAIKFTRGRQPAVIEFGHSSDGEKQIFFVRDNGVGFDMKYVNNLFSPFHRLHTEKEFEGTGIGLANVKRIITRHNGSVWVEAELDKGASFYFTLRNSRR